MMNNIERSMYIATRNRTGLMYLGNLKTQKLADFTVSRDFSWSFGNRVIITEENAENLPRWNRVKKQHNHTMNMTP